ncbi:MAG: protein translocase subunit SecF [Candidatus Gracilibacteria bacterium]|jgi:SecD/SecF fusion protein
MNLSPKRILLGKVLLILIFAGLLSYFDATSSLKLGLDLKGGTQLDYSIDLNKVAEADQQQIVDGVKEVIRKRVDSLGVSEPNIYTSNIANEYHIIVELAGVTDMEEAKALVGKTIQLEFKELNPNPDSTEQVAWAKESADAFLEKVNSGEDFSVLAETEQKANPSKIVFSKNENQELSFYMQSVQDAIKDKSEGELVGPVELTDASGIGGTGFVQIVDLTSEKATNEIPEKVSARHILISYSGADRATATRTKEEALALANEIKGKIDSGEKFEDLAKEYSDDGSKDNGGDLGSFERGVMTKNFEETAFSLEVGKVSDVIETEFGYHIITVYDHQDASSETINTETAALNIVIFSSAPDPWMETAALTGEHFKHADVSFNQGYQSYVSITFDDEGGKIFEELTGRNIGKPIAIFVGGNLISAPNVQSKISGGQAQITGDFTIEEAQTLARDLNTGAIPAPVTLSGQHNISASLGEEALNQSLFAGLIGVIILALFMILYYRLPGVIAVIALAIYSLMLIFVIKTALPIAVALLIGLGIFGAIIYLTLNNRDSGGEKFVAFLVGCFVLFFLTMVLSSQITLTLAGIAGVILSIGMAVDANILIFERMKEEMKEGRTLHQAIDEGFKRAWDSIRDSNFSSLITCAILFYFGSSIIRGFATNLALGILLSMFSAIMLSRTLLAVASDTRLTKISWLWTPKKKAPTHFPIMKMTKFWGSLSGLLAVIAIVAMISFGFNLGLDFTGGTMMKITPHNETLSSEDLKVQISADLTQVGETVGKDLNGSQITVSEDGVYSIRLKHITEEEHQALLAKFKETSPSLEEIKFTTVGPTIGASMEKKAIYALALASLMIVIYISFAFRKLPPEVSAWRFGVSAIVALIHDVLIVTGVFVVLGHFAGVEMDALFITAILTIMGFSVHDTIVVFDRIRENLHFRPAGETLTETANKALNQTMARSINTSLATLITIVALLIFGAASIKMFVLALTVGIVAGTYSSIFIASPLMVVWNNWATKSK